MSHKLVGVLLLVGLLGCSGKQPPQRLGRTGLGKAVAQRAAVQRRAEPPASRPSVPTPEGHVPSYYHPHASGRHDSHVNVERRPLTGITRTSFEGCKVDLPHHKAAPPVMVVVSPNSQHAVVVTSTAFNLFGLAGVCQTQVRRSWDPDISRWAVLTADAVATNDEVFLDGNPFSWTLEVHKDQQTASYRPAVARDFTRYDYVGIYNAISAGRDQRPYVQFESGQRWLTGKKRNFGQLSGHHALGALGADWSIVLAVDEKVLKIYAPAGDAQDNPKLLAARTLPRKVQWLSVAEPGVVVLEWRGTGTRLSAFSRAAVPKFALDVACLAYEPAISGGPGRLYVAGRGLCAIDNGKLTWTHAVGENAYATSFDDGSLAVAHGNQLELLTPDGKVAQSFETSEPLVTTPAIAGDGSVWVASNEALYVAR